MDTLDEVGEYMSSPVLRIDSASSVQEAAILMDANHIGSVIIEEYGKDVGIVTEKELTRNILAKGIDPEQLKVSEVMAPIKSMDRFLPIEEANRYMNENKIRHLAVTEEEKIVGILSIKDLVAYYSKDFRMQE